MIEELEHLSYRECLRAGAVQPGKKRGLAGILLMCINTWWEGKKKRDKIKPHAKFLLEQVPQTGCRVSRLSGDFAGHSPGQLALVGLV